MPRSPGGHGKDGAGTAGCNRLRPERRRKQVMEKYSCFVSQVSTSLTSVSIFSVCCCSIGIYFYDTDFLQCLKVEGCWAGGEVQCKVCFACDTGVYGYSETPEENSKQFASISWSVLQPRRSPNFHRRSQGGVTLVYVSSLVSLVTLTGVLRTDGCAVCGSTTVLERRIAISEKLSMKHLHIPCQLKSMGNGHWATLT